MNRVRRPGQAEFIQVLRRVNIEKIQYLISSNVSFDIESALFKGQVDQKVKSNQLVRDFKLKYNFGMIKNEILPSQKNDVLDGRRYAFLGIFGIVLTWRIFWDHNFFFEIYLQSSLCLFLSSFDYFFNKSIHYRYLVYTYTWKSILCENDATKSANHGKSQSY